jgi:hypothetical protein
MSRNSQQRGSAVVQAEPGRTDGAELEIAMGAAAMADLWTSS